jgi:hypothetical protein
MPQNTVRVLHKNFVIIGTINVHPYVQFRSL